jgi:outer membrane protein OmpA-like peptidoglycan-associated protein
MSKFVSLALCILVVPVFAVFNRTSGLVDIPTANILPHLGFRAGLDGSYNLSSEDAVVDETEINFHSSLGLFDHLEIYFDVYTIEDFTAAIGFCHNIYSGDKLGFAWGIHDISYTKYVSEVGRGDSIGWFDDMMYNTGGYIKPFELGSAFLLSTYSVHKNVDVTVGMGRGKYVGYGTHSKYFNSNYYHEQGGDWGIGLIAGVEARLGDRVRFMLDGDGRDVNVGFGFRLLPIDIEIALTKVEWWIWRSEPYAPSISAAVSFIRERPKLESGMIAGKVWNEDGVPLAAEVGINAPPYRKYATDPSSGQYNFSDVTPGVYEVYARAGGFEYATKKVTVPSGKIVYCDFRLSPASLPPGQIVGKATDLESGLPLIVDLTITETGAYSVSDSNGIFDFDSIAPGVYKVMAEAVGYEIGFHPVEVLPGKKTTLNIEMIRPRMSIALMDVKFDFAKAVIKPESYQILDDAAAVITNHPDIRVEVQGHTDAIGSDDSNMKLSYLRASAVREYLILKHDIDPLRLVPIGYGESRPVASNDTETGRAQNRRVEFLFLP